MRESHADDLTRLQDIVEDFWTAMHAGRFSMESARALVTGTTMRHAGEHGVVEEPLAGE